MNKYLQVGLFGFFMWMITFGVSVLLSSLRTSQRPLFESIMPVVVTACAVVFSILYFRNLKAGFWQEGLLIGVAWLGINIAIDLPLLLSASPMQMSFADYMMDIGITYLIIPVITIGFGFLLEQKAR